MKSKYSQNNQDLFVLDQLGTDPGFFVEFGADDGVTNSNTALLEKEYGWNGIICEPSIYCHDAMYLNRSCHIDTNCVYIASGFEIEFIDVGNGLSSLKQYADKDNWASVRAGGSGYTVNTISLKDLLDKYDAPSEIDYLSIDTEGSEYDILNAYDFSRHFKVITVEHNYTEQRERIYSLLISKGYKRVHEDVSQWDDWYIR